MEVAKNTPPVFVFAMANAEGSYKLNLIEEERKIREGLRGLKRIHAIEWEFRSSTRFEDLLREIVDLRDRLMVVHYAGHASGTHLEFESGSSHIAGAINAETLAQIMKLFPSLKLFFLNGCGTKAIAEQLLDAGVPAVIATYQEVPDRSAIQFADKFYSIWGNMFQSYTLQEAFELAVNWVNGTTQMVHKGGYRSIMWLDETEEGEDEHVDSLWGLFYHPDNTSILEETLPTALQSPGSAKQSAPSKQNLRWLRWAVFPILVVLGGLSWVYFQHLPNPPANDPEVQLRQDSDTTITELTPTEDNRVQQETLSQPQIPTQHSSANSKTEGGICRRS